MAHAAASSASPEAMEEELTRFDTPAPDVFDGVPDEAERQPEGERTA